jgi:hypothetical protein
VLLCQFQVRLLEVADEEVPHTEPKAASGNLSPLTLNSWLCALCGCVRCVAARRSLPSPVAHLNTGSGCVSSYPGNVHPCVARHPA